MSESGSSGVGSVPEPPADLLDTRAAGPIAARGAALRAGSYVLATLLGLLSVPLMIRHLGVADFGSYVLVLSIVAVVAGLTEAGVAAVALREYASQHGAERARVMSDLLGIRLVLTAAGVAAGTLFAVVAGYEPVVVVGVLVTGAALMLQSLHVLLTAALQSELRLGTVSALDLLRQALFVALVAALVVAGAGLSWFFVVQIPAFGIALGWTVLLVRRLVPLRPTFAWARWRALLRDTVAYAAAVAVNALYFRIAIIALSLLATKSETGYFATSFRVIEVLLGVPALVFAAAFPILARAARDDLRRLDAAASRMIELAIILGAWIALGVVLGARPIIRLMAGDLSDPAIELLRIQGAALVATSVAVAGGFVLLSLRRHREILWANAAALVAAIAVTLTLVPAYGATGAAVGVLVAEVVLGAMTFAALARARPSVWIAVRRAPAVLAAAAAAAAVVLAPGVPPLVETMLAVAAFPLLLLAVRRFPPELGEALRARRRTTVRGEAT